MLGDIPEVFKQRVYIFKENCSFIINWCRDNSFAIHGIVLTMAFFFCFHVDVGLNHSLLLRPDGLFFFHQIIIFIFVFNQVIFLLSHFRFIKALHKAFFRIGAKPTCKAPLRGKHLHQLLLQQLQKRKR